MSQQDDVALGRLRGFAAQGAKQRSANGWAPEPWHRRLANDDDLTWALANGDLVCAQNRVRAIVVRHYRRNEVPQHVESVLRYLGVRLDVGREAQ